MLPPGRGGDGVDLGEHPQLVQAAKGSEVEEDRTEAAPRQAEGEAPGCSGEGGVLRGQSRLSR